MSDAQSDLIARLEAVEAGSRDLNFDVWLAATGERPAYPFHPEDGPYIVYGNGMWELLPDVTRSIDAAVALVERQGLDPWNTLYAAMMHWKAHDPRGPLSRELPLSLCIALLKAIPAASHSLAGDEGDSRSEHNPLNTKDTG